MKYHVSRLLFKTNMFFLSYEFYEIFLLSNCSVIEFLHQLRISKQSQLITVTTLHTIILNLFFIPTKLS